MIYISCQFTVSIGTTFGRILILWNGEFLRLASAVTMLLPLFEPWNNNSFPPKHLQNVKHMIDLCKLFLFSTLCYNGNCCQSAEPGSLEIANFHECHRFPYFLEINYRHCSIVDIFQSWDSVRVTDTRYLTAYINFVCSVNELCQITWILFWCLSNPFQKLW